MSEKRSQLANWVAIQLALVTWFCLARQPFSTVQTSTSLISRLVRHFSGRHVERTASLHVLSGQWKQAQHYRGAEQFYAAHCFYDEDQARYPGRISPASPASLARAPAIPHD